MRRREVEMVDQSQTEQQNETINQMEHLQRRVEEHKELSRESTTENLNKGEILNELKEQHS